MSTMREISRREISSVDDRDAIRIGSLQRIADACELMAKDRERMIRDLEYYKKRAEESQERSRKLARRLTALRGVITRMRNREKDVHE